jgi:hypothetical protein
VRALWLGVLAVAGCNQIIGIDQLRGDETCRGTLANVCAHPLRGDLQLSSEGIDTDTDPRCEVVDQQVAGAPQLCVIGARNITLVNGVDATGSLPLVLFATGSIEIAGGAWLDVSSRFDHLGAGHDSRLCPPPLKSPTTGTGGGGSGGSFGTAGGHGGNGMSMATSGGQPAAAQMPVTAVRGGCFGDAGATGTSNAPGGTSGGVAYLIAVTSIDLPTDATIYASGAGGSAGGPGNGGGGGGGSGGLVAFEAPMLTLAGLVIAGGGGGGGGGAANAGTDGMDGATLFNGRANGGTGATSGASGGAGASDPNNDQPGNGGSTAFSGGGGGGGGGVVWLHGALTAMPTQITPMWVQP